MKNFIRVTEAVKGPGDVLANGRTYLLNLDHVLNARPGELNGQGFIELTLAPYGKEALARSVSIHGTIDQLGDLLEAPIFPC